MGTGDGRWESCALPPPGCASVTPPCDCNSGFLGWQYSFIATGTACMLFAPVIYLKMNPPPVTVKNVAQAGENIVLSELKALAKLLCNTPTFLILVVQGCFGGLPWSALQFRGFFFETAGLTKEEVTLIMTTIGFVGIFGGGFSGWLSDRLTTLNGVFGYDPLCNDQCTAPDTCPEDPTANYSAAGAALVFTSSVPWLVCGMLYTSLHYFYPRDMERIFERRRLENEQAEAALNTELVSS